MDLVDDHLTGVPSATSILLAPHGITANASAKLKSLAIYSYVNIQLVALFPPPGGIEASQALTEAYFTDTLTFNNPTLKGHRGTAYVPLECKGNYGAIGDGYYAGYASASYRSFFSALTLVPVKKAQ